MNIESKKRLRWMALGALMLTAAVNAIAAEPSPEAHQHHHAATTRTVAPAALFAATTENTYAALMDDAMKVMNTGMADAPMTGDADHDFAAMMIPHHQGAVDMAKTELLYGKNPVLRRLAQEIIVMQGSEIQVMQSQLPHRLPAIDKQ